MENDTITYSDKGAKGEEVRVEALKIAIADGLKSGMVENFNSEKHLNSLNVKKRELHIDKIKATTSN